MFLRVKQKKNVFKPVKVQFGKLYKNLSYRTSVMVLILMQHVNI